MQNIKKYKNFRYILFYLFLYIELYSIEVSLFVTVNFNNWKVSNLILVAFYTRFQTDGLCQLNKK